MGFDEIMKNDDRVYFSVREDEYRIFMEKAAEYGACWADGRKADPAKDSAAAHMAVRKDRIIAYVSMLTWFENPYGCRRLSFTEFLRGNEVDSKDRQVY